MKIAIIGLGVAGANTARIISAGHPEAQIEILTAEPHLYYARPKLPAYLAGELDENSLYFYPPAWYEERHMTVHTGAGAQSIDPAAHTVQLADGRSLPYDRLLLANGARAFVPPIPGSNLPGVFTLWTIEDAQRIRAYAAGKRRAVVIGGGLLGLEAARGLHVLGLEVTVLEFFPRLMPRQLDEPGAAIFQALIEKMGIAVRTGVATDHLEGADAVQAVALKSGESVPADLVLVAAGARSNLALAQASGLTVNKGVVVGAHLQTSAPDVYAAGDVAEFNGATYGIIPAALEQAQVAAQSLTGSAAEYKGTVPANTLKIVGLDLTSVGQATGGEGLVDLRRSDPVGSYIKLALKDGRLQGAILLGHKEKATAISQAVAKQASLAAYGEACLRDDFDWKQVR